MNKVIQGDCLEVLKTLDENSIDSIVTDPPYELGFMGKAWDSTGIANNKEMWAECLRVLKPGGHLLAFSGTRTYHRMASAIEDAGFEVRDMIEWVYGSGFPKSLAIDKAIDKAQGTYVKGGISPNSRKSGESPSGCYGEGVQTKTLPNPQSEEAKTWSGWGTALKPAHEPICMARKPLAEKTVAENVLKYGAGGINIDESRVGTEGGETHKGGFGSGIYGDSKGVETNKTITHGRFPANLIHDNSEEVRECFPETKSVKANRGRGYGDGIFTNDCNYEGTERGFDDSGNASRFFKSIIYKSKASKRDRGIGNNHPTVKSIALMEYLIKMVTPKGGIVLDPFAGSGSTLVAAKQNGFQYIGIEMTAEYIEIINKRLNL